MKKAFGLIKYFILMFLSSCFSTVKTKPDNVNDNEKYSFYDLKATTINDQEFDFSSLKGKKVLIVNVASKCGYTPQYAEFEKLHSQYKDKLVILGFPCNDFGGQEPAKENEIKSFCEKNYGVTFQLFSKISVKGQNIPPVYKWLTDKALNGWNTQFPTWNFCKYLIDEKGQLIKYYSSGVTPLSNEITDLLK